MSRIDPFGAGLTLGLLLAAIHAATIALVAFTATPWITDAVFGGQAVRATFALEGVDLSVAAFLVVMTIFAGCAIGWLFAALWNRLATLRPARLQQVAP